MAASRPTQIVTSAGPSFVSQLSLTQSDSDESFVSRHDQGHQPQIIVSPPSQEFSISNHTPVIRSSPPRQRQREARPGTPESIDDSTFEDASDSFFDANATPMPLDEDEDEVDPEFHSKQKWQRSASLEDVKEVISPPRAIFMRTQTDPYVEKMPRTRSHFSIPDVVVTSSEEEGQEMYFEMKVSPTRRKVMLPSHITGVDMQYEEFPQMREVPIEVNVKPKNTLKGSLFRIKSKPPPLQLSTRKISGPMPPLSAPPLSSVVESERPTLATRMRRSSLSNLFGRSQKDKEASPPPPSPALPAEWQANARPISPPLESPLSAESTEPPLSATCSTLEESSTSIHSPITPTFEPMLKRTQSKKELKAKMKEEKALTKVRERIDKLVRKHDKMKQKAASKQASGKENSNGATREGSLTASSSGSSNETPKKKRAIVSTTTNTKRQSKYPLKNTSANAKAMKAADFCARHVYVGAPHEAPPPRPIKAATRSAPTSSKSPSSNNPGEQRPQSKIVVERNNVKSIMRPGSVQAAGKRRSGGSFKASNGVLSASQRVSFVRKRQSLKKESSVEEKTNSASPTTADEVEEIIEEEAGEEPKESIAIDDGPPMIASSKRMTLLESLYKDIEEMELRFEEEYSITTRRYPLGVKDGNVANSVTFPISIAEQAIAI